MKKIVFILISFLLMACSANTNEIKETIKPCDVEKPCTETFDYVLSDVNNGGKADMSEYEGFVDDEHVFVEINMERAKEVFDNHETAIIYFGFPQCPWCKEAMPILNEAAKESNIKTIYYVQTRKDENKDMEFKQPVIDYMSEWLLKNDDGNPWLYNPDVVVIENGIVVSNHVGTLDDHDAEKRKMTDDEVEGLKEIYLDMLNQN